MILGGEPHTARREVSILTTRVWDGRSSITGSFYCRYGHRTMVIVLRATGCLPSKCSVHERGNDTSSLQRERSRSGFTQGNENQ